MVRTAESFSVVKKVWGVLAACKSSRHRPRSPSESCELRNDILSVRPLVPIGIGPGCTTVSCGLYSG